MRVALAALAAATIVFAAGRADAIPAFARKTGMGCPACHDAWPRLNDFGELYRDRGYRVDSQSDEPWYRALTNMPVSIRTSVGYQYSNTTNQATDQDPNGTTITSGGFIFPNADLLFGTNFVDHVSALVVASGFGRDGTVALESAWGRINDIWTPWLNLRVGKIELDLPASEHRTYTLTTPYLVYHYHPTGSSNGFNLGDNQLSAELSGHGHGVGLRYSLAVASDGGSPTASQWSFSAPTIYGHATYTMLPRSRIFSRVRIGFLFDVGWTPSQFKTLTPAGGMPAAIPGTGYQHRASFQVGGDAHATFGPLARPLTLSLAWLYGEDDKDLIANGQQNAKYHGGFVELAYTPLLALTGFFRFDGVFSLQQGDPTLPANSNDQTAFTVGARYAIWHAAWGSLMAHAEVSTTNTENAATLANPAAVRSTLVFAGFDFAL
jgi:hypothetical protein